MKFIREGKILPYYTQRKCVLKPPLNKPHTIRFFNESTYYIKQGIKLNVKHTMNE